MLGNMGGERVKTEKDSVPPASLAGVVGKTTTFNRTMVLPRKKRDAIEHPTAHPRYEHVRRLGEGGMGEVALVRDLDIGRRVAVKRLLPGANSDAAMLRFADEVRVTGRLEHPAIVPVYDVGVDEDGLHYAVMKYIEGETLEAIIKKLKKGDAHAQKRFSYEYRVQIFLTIVQAVRYAHDQGIIHRDLKPANIMIGPHGEVQVLDWGIAKVIDTPIDEDGADERAAIGSTLPVDDHRLIETKAGSLLGTPLYMSPEQARGEDLDERSDIFSLCMLFYELLTLEHPLAKKKTVAEVISTLSDVPFSKTALSRSPGANGVPCEYVFFLFNGLKFDKTDRFQSLQELEERLLAVQAGDFPAECPITLTKRGMIRGRRWMDRNKGAFMLMLLFTMLGLLGGLVFGIVKLVQHLV
jgi:eukaryotic-like serine/threonine-protein kinase